jgi:hypothetical protein
MPVLCSVAAYPVENDVTPAELIDSMMATAQTALTALAIYLTVLTGYMVAAYAVGADLTKYQIWFINFLFVTFTTPISWVTYVLFNLTAVLPTRFGEVESSWVASGFNLLLFAVQLLAIVGALVFMNAIRKKNGED